MDRVALFLASLSLSAQSQLKKLQKDKIKHKNNFYVFTGSCVGVVPILGKGVYKGIIDKLGSVSTKIS